MKNLNSNKPCKIRVTDGQYLSVEPEELLTAAQQCIRQQLSNGEALDSAKTAKQYFQLQLGALGDEAFHAIWLDSQHWVIALSEIARGTIDSASIYLARSSKKPWPATQPP